MIDFFFFFFLIYLIKLTFNKYILMKLRFFFFNSESLKILFN